MSLNVTRLHPEILVHLKWMSTLNYKPSQGKPCGGFFDAQKEVMLCPGSQDDLAPTQVVLNWLTVGFVKLMPSRKLGAMKNMIVLLLRGSATGEDGSESAIGTLLLILYVNSVRSSTE